MIAMIFDDWNDGLGCDFEHPLRASHASPSRSEGEEGVLVWPAGGGRFSIFWWGLVCPLCPSDISPASERNPATLPPSFRLSPE